MNREKAHLHYLDGLRALAASYVVFHHAAVQTDLTGTGAGIAARALAQFFNYGHYAVDVFIVLSGFCLMLPILRNGELIGGAPLFLKRRAWRILPPYFLAMGFSLVLIATIIGRPTGTHWDVSLPVTGWDALRHTLLIQDLFTSTAPKINHAFWSISVEWRIYFLFPALVVWFRRSGPWMPTCAMVVIGMALFLVVRRTPLDARSSCPHYLGLFTLGMFSALLGLGNPGRFAWYRDRLPWGVVTAALIVVTIVLVKGWNRVPSPIVDLLVGLCTVALLVAASRDPRSRLGAALGCAPLAWLGTFAYSIYLVHAPLVQVMTQLIVFPLKLDPERQLFANLLLAPFVILAAYPFFWVCERPFLRLPSRGAERSASSVSRRADVAGVE